MANNIGSSLIRLASEIDQASMMEDTYERKKLLRELQRLHEKQTRSEMDFPREQAEAERLERRWQGPTVPESAGAEMAILQERLGQRAVGGQELTPVQEAMLTGGVRSPEYIKAGKFAPAGARSPSSAIEELIARGDITDKDLQEIARAEAGLTPRARVSTGEAALMKPGITETARAYRDLQNNILEVMTNEWLDPAVQEEQALNLRLGYVAQMEAAGQVDDTVHLEAANIGRQVAQRLLRSANQYGEESDEFLADEAWLRALLNGMSPLAAQWLMQELQRAGFDVRMEGR